MYTSFPDEREMSPIHAEESAGSFQDGLTTGTAELFSNQPGRAAKDLGLMPLDMSQVYFGLTGLRCKEWADDVSENELLRCFGSGHEPRRDENPMVHTDPECAVIEKLVVQST